MEHGPKIFATTMGRQDGSQSFLAWHAEHKETKIHKDKDTCCIYIYIYIYKLMYCIYIYLHIQQRTKMREMWLAKPQLHENCKGWLKLHPEDGQLPLGAAPTQFFLVIYRGCTQRKCRYKTIAIEALHFCNGLRSSFSKWIEIHVCCAVPPKNGEKKTSEGGVPVGSWHIHRWCFERSVCST